jgi:ABC-type transport system involved in multi-copper enzyme maturation permease subunit
VSTQPTTQEVPLARQTASIGNSGLDSSQWRVFLALVLDTVQEARARWLFWGLFGLSTLLILFFLFVLKIDLVAGAVAIAGLPVEASRKIFNMEKFVRNSYKFIAVFLYVWGTFLAIFASAGLMPAVLEPGRIGLLLSKPVTRPMLLVGRYAGNLLVVTLNHAYLVTAIYIIVGLKTDIWHASFLYAIPVTVFLFAVLLTVVVFIGVVSESAALSLMVTVALVFISMLLASRKIVVNLLSSEWSRDLWQALYWMLPKAWDLGGAMQSMILGEPANWLEPVWTSAAFGVFVFGAALYVFQKKDY